MTDIVERLRHFAKLVGYDLAPLLAQAAEIIEQYRADSAHDEQVISRLAQGTPTLTLLSPSNLPMENDPDVLQVARAIAERGIGRYWDDFPETDAFDTDQGDLIEYARAAVEIFRRSAPAVTSTDGAPEPFKPHENCNCVMCIAEGGEK